MCAKCQQVCVLDLCLVFFIKYAKPKHGHIQVVEMDYYLFADG